MIDRETFAAYLEEIVARGVLRALREAGLARQAATHPRPLSEALLTAGEVGRRLRVPRRAVYELVRAGRQELEDAKTKSA
jgi:hypothetical protein